MNSIAPYAKALVGALIAGLASLQQALDGDNTVTAQEWTGVTIALLSGLALVWAIPNKDPQARHQADSVQPPERGETYLGVIVGVLLVVILVVVLMRLL